MNEAEKIAYEHLLQYYNEDEITYQPNKTPDFICDGNRYEVKKLYKDGQLLFNTLDQLDAVKRDTILVVDANEEEVVDALSADQLSNKYSIKIQYNTQNIVLAVKLRPKTIEWIDKYIELTEHTNRSEALRSLISIAVKSVEKEVQLEEVS